MSAPLARMLTPSPATRGKVGMRAELRWTVAIAVPTRFLPRCAGEEAPE
jgi:hypothetical protein